MAQGYFIFLQADNFDWYLWKHESDLGNMPSFPLLPARLESLTDFPTAGAVKSWRYQGEKKEEKNPLTCPQTCNFIPPFYEILFWLSAHFHMVTC